MPQGPQPEMPKSKVFLVWWGTCVVQCLILSYFASGITSGKPVYPWFFAPLAAIVGTVAFAVACLPMILLWSRLMRVIWPRVTRPSQAMVLVTAATPAVALIGLSVLLTVIVFSPVVLLMLPWALVTVGGTALAISGAVFWLWTGPQTEVL